MRQKARWFGLLWLLMTAALVAGAAGMPQLTDIGVFSRANYGAVITLHVNGGFTHNDYRPSDDSMIVDLPGVAPGTVDGAEQIFNLQGLRSYKVASYSGLGGVQAVRVQIMLDGRPSVRVTEIRDGLMIHISPDESVVPGAMPAAPPSMAEMPSTGGRESRAVTSAPPATLPDQGALMTPPKFGSTGGSTPMASLPERVPPPVPSSRQAVITDIAVVPGVGAPTVEVTANEPLNPKVMRLNGPPRLVLDFANATLAGKTRNITVESGGVKAVRVGRFQAEPPITRLVIDLSEARDIDISRNGTKLVVKLRPVGHSSIEAGVNPAKAMNNSARGDAGEQPPPALEVPGRPSSEPSPADSPALALSKPQEPVAELAAARMGSAAPALPVAAPAASNSAPNKPEMVADVQEDAIRQPVSLSASGAISPLAASSEPVKAEPAPVPPTKVIAETESAAVVESTPKVAAPAVAEPLPNAPPAVAKVEADKPATMEPPTPAMPEMKPVLLAKLEPQEPLPAQADSSVAQRVESPVPPSAGAPPAATAAVLAAPAESSISKPAAPAPAPMVATLPAPPDAAPAPQASATAASTPAAPATPNAAPMPVPQTLPRQPAVNFAAEQRHGVNEGAAVAQRFTGEPISVNLKDVDLKDFFRLIHEISGLNIVLDPSVNGSLTLILDDVPWDQALQIVLKNHNLESELQGNVLRVATIDTLRKEAESRQKQTEAQALAVAKVTATRFLSYAHAKDVLPLLKRMLSVRGEIVADDRTNALIISDIPSIIPRIDILIAQLDRKTQEVEIEARVIAATRTFIRDIGTQVGFGFGNSATAVGGAVASSPTQVGYSGPPSYITSPIITKTTTTGTTAASIPLFSNLGALSPTSGLSLLNLGRNYRLDVILSAAESRGLLKVLSRPRVITQNNVQAVVKQGQRIPITTIGQLGGPPTTTYIDAVLRLTVTPQITAERSIFLNVDIENTQADLSNEVNGNPVFNTQQSTTQVLVTDGGTVVIGGVVQTQNTINVQQVPILGNVPGLGNLFKRRMTNTSTQELIFFITPKIVET